MSTRLSFSTSICPTWPLALLLRCAADLGYDGIELAAARSPIPLWRQPELSGTHLPETCRRLRDVGLTVSCVGTGQPLDQPDEAGRRAANDEAERSLDLAATVGAAGIEVFVGDGGTDASDGLARIAETLLVLTERAANYGVDVWLATRGAASHPSDVASILRAVSSERLGVLWDPAMSFMESGATVEDAAALARSIRHARLRDVREHEGRWAPCPIAQGQFPVWQAVAAMNAWVPAGWLVLDPPGLPTADAAEVALHWVLRWTSDLLRDRASDARPANGWVTSAGRMRVEIHSDRPSTGAAAAAAVGDHLRAALTRSGDTSLILASAPSQNEFLEALRGEAGIDWSRVTAFHLDEYLGLSPEHPASFRRFLLDRFVRHVPLRAFHGLDGLAADPAAECARYSALLRAHPPALAVLGVGENAHLAFIDPPICDFFDAATVRVVELDDACRTQQVHDGCFARLEEVPRHALSLTIPYLLSVPRAVAIVPGPRKQAAVRAAVLGPVTPACPASILRRHRDATLYLDSASAATILRPEPPPAAQRLMSSIA